MRRRVSGDMPTVNSLLADEEEGVKEVMVRQVPFMEMESPRWASWRRKAGVEIVRVVPVGEGVRADIAVGRGELLEGFLLVEGGEGRERERDLLPMHSTMPVNMVEMGGERCPGGCCKLSSCEGQSRGGRQTNFGPRLLREGE